MEASTILKRLDGIKDLPTLPTIAVKVNSMLQDYDTSIKELAQVIENDQAMVPKLLKLVNSAFFGFRSEISNVGHAIVILGFNTVRNAVLSLSVFDAFSGKATLDDFNITDFWAHSVAVAITSKHLAQETRLQSTEDAFTAGLLHDIGKVILAHYLQDLFGKVWISARQNNLDFYDAEKKEIPIDHARIGGYLAKKWQLPGGLIDSIRYHHALSKHANDLNLLVLVHVADTLVNNAAETIAQCEVDISKIHPDAAELVMPQLNSAAEWYPNLKVEIESACQFFFNGEG